MSYEMITCVRFVMYIGVGSYVNVTEQCNYSVLKIDAN